VKNILDEIRTMNMVMIPGEERQRGREEKYVCCHGGHGRFED
jgi:hypothetical protein